MSSSYRWIRYRDEWIVAASLGGALKKLVWSGVSLDPPDEEIPVPSPEELVASRKRLESLVLEGADHDRTENELRRKLAAAERLLGRAVIEEEVRDEK